MRFISFWELLRYVKRNNMCTDPGCTTCGCMPFRKMCRDEIGYEEMCRLISEVTPEQISSHSPYEWYEPLRIIYDVVFADLPEDAPLMKEYFSIRERLLREKAQRIADAEARKQEEHEQAVARKLKNRLEHEERSRIKNEEYRRTHGLPPKP